MGSFFLVYVCYFDIFFFCFCRSVWFWFSIRFLHFGFDFVRYTHWFYGISCGFHETSWFSILHRTIRCQPFPINGNSSNESGECTKHCTQNNLDRRIDGKVQFNNNFFLLTNETLQTGWWLSAVCDGSWTFNWFKSYVKGIFNHFFELDEKKKFHKIYFDWNFNN